MLTIDGAMGEGGGQVLRASLALAACTGAPFRIDGIRAGRARPGLLRQHLCAVRAAAAVCGADVDGDALGATSLRFTPGPIRGGTYHFAVGSAGSAGLVLQTVLWPLLAADGPSEVTIDGGTHNPASPPAEFLLRSFVPALRRAGADVSIVLRGHGFYPAGGGRYHVSINPSRLQPLHLPVDLGPVTWSVRAITSNLPKHVAEREIALAAAALGASDARPESVRSPGPGNAVVVVGEAGTITEVFTAFGAKARSAESVAQEAVDAARAWADGGAPVGEHLADQLLLPIALAGGGGFRTGPPSLHTTTLAAVIERFTGQRFTFAAVATDDRRVDVRL